MENKTCSRIMERSRIFYAMNGFKIPQRSCIMSRRYQPRETRRLETSFTQTCEPWVPITCVSKLTSKDRKCGETSNTEKGAPNDGYNLISEYKEGRSTRGGGRVDTGSETEPIHHKTVMSGQSRDQSAQFDKKPSVGTQGRSKTAELGLHGKKKSFTVSNKRLDKKPSNPTKTEKKINKPLKKTVKLEKDGRSKPIKTEDKLVAVLNNNGNQTEKKRIVKDKKSTFKTDNKTGAFHSSKSNGNDCDDSSYSATPRKKKSKESPHVAKLKSKKISKKVAEEPFPALSEKENVGSNDDDLMIAITNQKTISNDEDSQPRSVPNHRIVKRLKSSKGVRRNIPRSSVMTIWHWLRQRSCYDHPTPTKESSMPEDPFLSLFFPAMIASDLSASRMIRDESKTRKLRE